jgi:hypothetical protein
MRTDEIRKANPTRDIVATSEDDSLQGARSALQHIQTDLLQVLRFQVDEVAHTSTFDGQNQ